MKEAILAARKLLREQVNRGEFRGATEFAQCRLDEAFRTEVARAHNLDPNLSSTIQAVKQAWEMSVSLDVARIERDRLHGIIDSLRQPQNKCAQGGGYAWQRDECCYLNCINFMGDLASLIVQAKYEAGVN